jgi:hypothetical protein
MSLLNLTHPTTALVFNQTLQLINCTANFWYTYDNQLGLVGSIGSLAGGVVCSIVPFLDVSCNSTVTVTQAAAICTRPNQIQIQQKCLNNELNPSLDIQEYIFVQKTTYASIFNVFQSHNQLQCDSICSRIDKCIGTNYVQSNCILYM